MKAISVLSPARFKKLLAADSKNVSRDPVLLFAIIFSLVPALAFVFARETMDEAALSAFGVVNISVFLAPIVLVLPAYLIGWVTGFLILEERDDGPLLALDITPVGKQGFALHRSLVTMAIAFLITIVAAPQVLPGTSTLVALALAVFVALQAVAVAFTLPAIARNKVEGLAVTKVLNIFSIAPLLAIIPSPLRYLGGFIPAFWVGELLGLGSGTYLSTPLIIVLGLACHLLIAWLMYHLLARRIG